MRWLRNMFSARSKNPIPASSARSNGFRPKVESLDDRIVPTVSTAITNAGTFTLAVNTDNVLVALDPATGAQTAATAFTNVRTAQAFRTATGGLGADIVYRDGSWQHIDSAAPLGNFTISADQAKAQFGGLILDAGTAYTDAGLARLDFIVSNSNTLDPDGHTFSNATGNVMEFNQETGGGLVNTGLANALWVSAYNATDGGTGIALGQVSSLHPTTFPGDYMLLVRKGDATGVTTLFNGIYLTPGNAVVEYSQTTSLPTAGGGLGGALGGALGGNAAPRGAIVDVTFEGYPTVFAPGAMNDGGYAIHYTIGSTGAVAGGLFGGGGAGGDTGLHVTGIVSPDNTIKTGVFYPGMTFAP
jgi:hypothetical protein